VIFGRVALSNEPSLLFAWLPPIEFASSRYHTYVPCVINSTCLIIRRSRDPWDFFCNNWSLLALCGPVTILAENETFDIKIAVSLNWLSYFGCSSLY